jgi:hypothetical protein
MHLYITNIDPFSVSCERTTVSAEYNEPRRILYLRIYYASQQIEALVGAVLESVGATTNPTDVYYIAASDRLAKLINQTIREGVEQVYESTGSLDFEITVETNVNILDVIYRRAAACEAYGESYDVPTKTQEYITDLFEWYAAISGGAVSVILRDYSPDYEFIKHVPDP